MPTPEVTIDDGIPQTGAEQTPVAATPEEPETQPIEMSTTMPLGVVGQSENCRDSKTMLSTRDSTAISFKCGMFPLQAKDSDINIVFFITLSFFHVTKKGGLFCGIL